MPELAREDVQKIREALPPHVWGMLQNTRSLVAGGFIRDLLTGDIPKDLDIFSPYSPRDFFMLNEAYVPPGSLPNLITKNRTATFNYPEFKYPIQVIYRPDPQGVVVNEFDFTVNSVMVDSRTSWAHEDFYTHLKSRLLVVANDKSLRARTILHRMFRLAARGYTIDNLSLAKIISIVANGALAKDGFIEKEDRLFQALLHLWKIEYDPNKEIALPAIVGDEVELVAARHRPWRIQPTIEDYDDQNRGEGRPEQAAIADTVL